MVKFLLGLFVVFIVVFNLYRYYDRTGYDYGTDLLPFFRGSIKLSSPDFGNGDKIPPKFSCDAGNVSPTLYFSGVPEKTKSLAIIMEDSTSLNKPFTHWLVYDLNPEIKQYSNLELSNTGQMGINDFGNFGYNGPCPLWGEIHRYHFRIYALSIELDTETLNRTTFDSLIKDHIIARGVLTGVYSRNP